MLEEYIPIRIDGSVPAVFEIYRNAAPILAAVDATGRDVLFVSLAAAGVLAILLFLIFRAAQSRLARQTTALLDASRRDALTGSLNHGTAVAELAGLLETTGPAGPRSGWRCSTSTTSGCSTGHTVMMPATAPSSRSPGSSRAEVSQATVLGRYGPDEFILIAPPACVHDLEPAIDRLRARVGELTLQFGASERLPVTVSGGISYAPVNGQAATELLAVAARALTEAKVSGGNVVRVADMTSDDLATAQRSSFDVLTGLVAAVDTKDHYTKQHSEDVARYASSSPTGSTSRRTNGDRSGWRGCSTTSARSASPTRSCASPVRSRPTSTRSSSSTSGSATRSSGDLPNVEAVRAGVRHHHERWDGGGYLDGLAGEDIPLDRPDRRGRRHVQRDDDHPPVPQGHLRAGSARSPPGRGRIAARPPARRRLRRRGSDRRRPAAPGRRADQAPGLDADLERTPDLDWLGAEPQAAVRPGRPVPAAAGATAACGPDAAANLDEFVGQEHLVGERGPLRRSSRADHLGSLILWGPPGTGKTTLARLLADAIGARLVTLSRRVGGVAESGRRSPQARTLTLDGGSGRSCSSTSSPLQQGPAGRAPALCRGRHGSRSRGDN